MESSLCKGGRIMTDEMYNLLYMIETLTQCVLYIFLCITCCVWIRRSR